jgi:hypothetical protein
MMEEGKTPHLHDGDGVNSAVVVALAVVLMIILFMHPHHGIIILFCWLVVPKF